MLILFAALLLGNFAVLWLSTPTGHPTLYLQPIILSATRGKAGSPKITITFISYPMVQKEAHGGPDTAPAESVIARAKTATWRRIQPKWV